MPKAKTTTKQRKPKRDFAQTAFDVVQKATGAKPNTRQSGQRHSRSGRGNYLLILVLPNPSGYQTTQARRDI